MNTENHDAISEVSAQLNALNDTINKINLLYSEGMFKYLSKNARNELLNELIEHVGAFEDASKAAVRTLKKIKRERLPESISDLLVQGEFDPERFKELVDIPTTSVEISTTFSSFPDPH